MDLPIVKSIRRKTDVKVVEVGRKLLKKQKRRGKVKLSSKNDATVIRSKPSNFSRLIKSNLQQIGEITAITKDRLILNPREKSGPTANLQLGLFASGRKSKSVSRGPSTSQPKLKKSQDQKDENLGHSSPISPIEGGPRRKIFQGWDGGKNLFDGQVEGGRGEATSLKGSRALTEAANDERLKYDSGFDPAQVRVMNSLLDDLLAFKLKQFPRVESLNVKLCNEVCDAFKRFRVDDMTLESFVNSKEIMKVGEKLKVDESPKFKVEQKVDFLKPIATTPEFCGSKQQQKKCRRSLFQSTTPPRERSSSGNHLADKNFENRH